MRKVDKSKQWISLSKNNAKSFIVTFVYFVVAWFMEGVLSFLKKIKKNIEMKLLGGRFGGSIARDETFNQMLFLSVFHKLLRISEGDVHWCFVTPSVHDVFLYLFDRALFLQCSHITSMQSPYVLNSNVVNYRRIFSVQQWLCKNDTSSDTHKQIQWWQSLLMHILAFSL